jgi:transcription initiation factor TFIIB
MTTSECIQIQMSNSDGALANAYDEISNMADRLNLHRKIVDKANRLLKSIHNRKILKGHSTDAVASACLYIICRSVL